MHKFIELYKLRNKHKIGQVESVLSKIANDLPGALWVNDPDYDTGYLIHYYGIDLTGEDILYLNKHLEQHGYLLSYATSANNTLCITPV